MIIKFPESADVDMEMFGGNRDTVKQVKKMWKDIRTRWLNWRIMLQRGGPVVEQILEVGEINTDDPESDGVYIFDNLFQIAVSGELYKRYPKACNDTLDIYVASYKEDIRDFKRQLEEDKGVLVELQRLLDSDDKGIRKFKQTKWKFKGKLTIEDVVTKQLPEIFNLWEEIFTLKPKTAVDALWGFSIIRTGKQDKLSRRLILLDYKDPRADEEIPICLVDNGTNQLVHMWMDY